MTEFEGQRRWENYQRKCRKVRSRGRGILYGQQAMNMWVKSDGDGVA